MSQNLTVHNFVFIIKSHQRGNVMLSHAHLCSTYLLCTIHLFFRGAFHCSRYQPASHPTNRGVVASLNCSLETLGAITIIIIIEGNNHALVPALHCWLSRDRSSGPRAFIFPSSHFGAWSNAIYFGPWWWLMVVYSLQLRAFVILIAVPLVSSGLCYLARIIVDEFKC